MMKRTMMTSKGFLRVSLIVLMISLLLVPAMVCAEQFAFPGSAFTDEELAKVREWEKTWAGKKIDQTNVDQVKEYLPESYYGVYKKPDVWNEPKGFWFTIASYK